VLLVTGGVGALLVGGLAYGLGGGRGWGGEVAGEEMLVG
jgi:hypothetical protein